MTTLETVVFSGSEPRAIAFLAAYLGGDARLARAVVAFVRDQTPTARDATSFEARVGRFVIRDKDLDLFGVVRDAVVATVPTNALDPNGNVALVVATIVAVVQVIRNLRRKGVWLDYEFVPVLAAASGRDRLTVAELTERLRATWPDQTDEATRDALESLKQVALPDGEVTPLVDVDSAGRWGAVNG